MKNVIISIILILSLIQLSACSSATLENKSHSNTQSINKVDNNTALINENNNVNLVNANNNNTVSNNSSSKNLESGSNNKTLEINSPKGNSDNVNSNTITDINNWSHPVKYVFNNANIQIQKVEFKENKTYPIFYVNLTKNIDSENKTYYKNLISQIAIANGYWNYEIIDTKKDVDIKVTCDRSKSILKEIIYNKDSNYFVESNEDKKVINNTDDEFINYLINNVGEVKSFVNSLKNNKNVNSIIYVERYPDENSKNSYIRDYYGIYVGEEHTDHNVNIYRFAINKDSKEILYYDVINDKYETLNEWRKNK
ncbi:hypothetical protein CPAST_c00550 [Clostridium pasteurianum DSM 525 = ATCC 6013]|uniref:Lipoprotein n=1 Tax=Clostridium pasteurianum DSM 525 = ATCC 6013 TaxID=1262449 RepID=A0A0H3J5G7_CLOPA|nr:hypothetical protein [Clostridium pasteurianum]AJA46180.1 hypothetical protein CPAST_c00550 [Clostridium pasteurianum DSM 525 = ATCC 6013]AJA50168.1 hypothetical protein CLPA_c00550 [Clostridium pasteurianum DSM 525 = ATCC 6013]AOZ73640.1 hypothetical protein AQ983_00275 [Clostridium pasteurianum DSM 525 = ATCC 6013]AOZ77437.1 hypothetical protein AQ984_00275 [Clostridium pasteurianum]ELP57438.1 hypothetical protein F502_19699 [Clostridium pasteurianum DSM 525 = ATCC 6013]